MNNVLDPPVAEVETRACSGVILALQAAVSRVLDDDDSGHSSAALGEDLIAIRREVERLEAGFADKMQRFELGRGHAADGAVSAVAWVRHACRMSQRDAAMRIGTARELPLLPLTKTAYRDGDIGVSHAAIIAHLAKQLGDQHRDAMTAAEPVLVETAKTRDLRTLRWACEQVRTIVDPDGAQGDANALFDKRWLQLSKTLDGMYAIDGLLDPESGAMLKTVLQSLMPAPAKDDERSTRQRRADALTELARRALDAGDLPASGGQRPHLQIHAAPDTLAHNIGVPGAYIQWGGIVPPATAQRHACDASVTTITVDNTGTPTSVSATSRTFPSWLRKALIARDGGCQFPGCDRPPEWCDGHHIDHYEDGGLTNLDNGTLLCRRHHTFVHERGCVLTRSKEHGRLVVALPEPSAQVTTPRGWFLSGPHALDDPPLF